MPDCKNKVRIGFPDQKYVKSGIIHNWAEGGGHLVVSPQNGGPLGGTTLCAQQKSKQLGLKSSK